MGKPGRINTSQIKDQVYEQCRGLILDRTWKPGSKLPSESELCDLMGVSRVSVRAALQSLEAQGYIDIRRGEGSFVRDHSLSDQLNLLLPVFALGEADVMDVLEYRLIVEPGLMPLVTERITESQLRELRNNYERMVTSVDDVRLFAQYDEQFHVQLIEVISNSIVLKIYRVLFEVFRSSWHEICEVLGTRDGIRYHKEILDALQGRDGSRAAELMQDHVRVTQERMRDHYRSARD